MNDAALVGLALADPSQGVAAIYDQYGERLYNYCYSILRSQADAGDALQECFLTVMDKLGQLRDPDKLRPWLYAVARNQCFKAHRLRKRERPEDPFETGEEQAAMAASSPEPAAGELVAMVWEATAGLSDIDRSVLELNIRHELDGEELAESLGVPGPKCSVLLHRAKDRLKTAVGALIVSKVGVDNCAELAGIVDGSEFNPLIRKRVARHIKGCATCEETERRHRPEAYLAALPLLRVPDAVRDNVLATISSPALPSASTASQASTGTHPSVHDAAAPELEPGALGAQSDTFDWDEAGFPRPNDAYLAQAGVGSQRRGVVAAVAVTCAGIAIMALLLFGPFRQETTVVAGPGPVPVPTELPRPEFLPTSTPLPSAGIRLVDPEPAAAVEPTATPTPSPAAEPATEPPSALPTTAPVATVSPTPSPTATAAPTATATSTPLPTVTPIPTATPAAPAATPAAPQAPTPGPAFADFVAPTVSSFSVGCGDPFTILVTVADNVDPSPTTDLEATWDNESDPAVPLTQIIGTTYRAQVPRSELDGESIDFFVRGTVRDSSGNVRNLDLTDGCIIIG